MLNLREATHVVMPDSNVIRVICRSSGEELARQFSPPPRPAGALKRFAFYYHYFRDCGFCAAAAAQEALINT
jgi:hypothetical protein